MRLPRRLLPALALPCIARAAHAQAPAPLRLIVGFTPGGTNDIVARLAAETMGPLLGQSIVVENRPGAGGMLAADLVAKAPPDGNTILLGGSGGLVIPSLVQARLPFDIATGFAPIGMIGAAPNVIVVHPALPVRDMVELQRVARAARPPLTFASPGIGSTGHAAWAMLVVTLGIELEHIPYRGTAPALTDLIAGRVQVFTNALAPMAPHIASGALRAVAVAGPRRSPAMPELPSTAEQGFPAIDCATWWGLFAPAGTPAERVARLHAALGTMLAQLEVRRRLLEGGVEIEASESPAAFARAFAEDRARWEPVMRAAGVRPE
ncbi:MAG: tripartite tricarboxylate transporter substrate binding protein [Acetobacteraceae bacterium]|nr:tripartite tricarboxylate transporter substrate binding protein [Acetobacteraceae bacterium]